MDILDRPGALAKIASALGECGVSIDRVRQRQHEGSDRAPVLIVTHKTQGSAVHDAIALMRQTNVLESEPVALRIETV